MRIPSDLVGSSNLDKRTELLPVAYWLCLCSKSAKVYCFMDSAEAGAGGKHCSLTSHGAQLNVFRVSTGMYFPSSEVNCKMILMYLEIFS